MQQGFWADRWRSGQIGFHLSAVNRHLQAHAGQLPAPPVPVLVPLCGKSHDLAWLADRGHTVVGVEFVEQAARAFFEERNLQPEEGRLGPHLSLASGRITLVVADFFALEANVVGRFTGIWDRAALIAMPPDQQRPYLKQLRALTMDDGHVLMVTFDHDIGTGPPFSISDKTLQPLSDGLFRCDLIADQDILSEEPRFRERGATRVHEQVFVLRPI
jgi:thiopurine S-methyltransferase